MLLIFKQISFYYIELTSFRQRSRRGVMNGNKNNPPYNPFMCESESDGGFLVLSYFRSVLPDSRYNREQIKNADTHDGNGSYL